MIITRAPLRIDFAGGVTDEPSYYEKYGGFLVYGSIDKYVYISIQKPLFTTGICLRYSKIEQVKTIDEIKHPIIREVLRLFECEGPLEISCFADIPGGTGLGSSGSFTVALIKAVAVFMNRSLQAREIAEIAYDIEAVRLHRPVGVQDQFAAAFGGINSMSIYDRIDVVPVKISPITLHNLENNLLMFYTGYSRRAEDFLLKQKSLLDINDSEIIKNYDTVKDEGFSCSYALKSGDMKLFAETLTAKWATQRKRSNEDISNNVINYWYDVAMAFAQGGMIAGAGGGGFLVFYVDEENRHVVRSVMRKAEMKEVEFKFDFEGVKVCCQ